MIPQMPYYALDLKQVDKKWIENGYGLEANVFNGNDFLIPGFWSKLDDALNKVYSMSPKLFTLHFPTDNGDYLNYSNNRENLLRFIDLAHKYNISGITIHANQFISIEEYLSYPLQETRKQMLEYYAELDEYLKPSGVWIGVENLPIIGNEGNDFDPIFIYPEDYSDFQSYDYQNIYITWDICHWGITYLTHQSINTLLHRQMSEIDFNKFLELPRIKHFHFASFRSLAMPYSSVTCYEGIHPLKGDLDSLLLAQCIKRLEQDYPMQTGIVFEIQEEDYYNRKNIWEVLDWYKNCVRL